MPKKKPVPSTPKSATIVPRIKRIVLSLLSLLGYLLVSVGIWGGTIVVGSIMLSGYGLVLIGGALIAIFGTVLSVLLNVYPLRNLQLFSALFLFVQLCVAYLVFGTSAEGFFVMMMMVLLHLALYSFFFTKRIYFENRLHTYTWSMSTVGVATLGSIMGVIISIMIGMQLLNAEVKCDKIYDSIETLVLSPVQPISNAARRVSERGNRSVDDVVDMSQMDSYSGALSLVSRYDVAKAKVVDEIVDDKEQVRASICEIIATNVEKNIQNGLGFVPTMVLLFLIVSPLVSIVFRLLSIVIWLLLQLLIITRIFSWKKRVRHTKELG